MKIILTVHNGNPEYAWEETYDQDSVLRAKSWGKIPLETTPENFGTEIVAWFNRTAREGQKQRTLVRSEIQR